MEIFLEFIVKFYSNSMHKYAIHINEKEKSKNLNCMPGDSFAVKCSPGKFHHYRKLVWLLSFEFCVYVSVCVCLFQP